MGGQAVRWAALALATLLAGCGGDVSNPVPPRVTAPKEIPMQSSAIAVPISARLSELQQLADREVPRTLATIDEKKPACLKVKVIGNIGCRLVGEVTRGPIKVGGSGNVMTLTMPVAATVSAKDIGKVVSETATAAAIVTATVRLDSIGDWQPNAKVDVSYVWTKKPGVDVLGQRLTFARKADPVLARLIARLEADVPRHIAKLQPRERLAKAWEKAFTSVSINAKNPPVWIRITPQALRFDRYEIDKEQLTLHLGATATTETFVGPRPADPVPTPLPSPAPRDIAPDTGFRFHLPVIADYAELEPVLEKALGKLAKKPMELPGIGTVEPEFGKVTMYATTGSRLAIGMKMRVKTPGQWIDARGTVWVTGQPFNEPGSQLVKVRDLRVEGKANSPSFSLLLAVAESERVSTELSGALSQNFARDYDKLLAKAGKAIAEKRVGDFVLKARIDHVKNGVVYPAGQGLYMPVDALGTASLAFSPRTE